MHENSKPSEISVIIPAFNEGEIIGSVVRRVREVLDAYGQTYEILVIDDGSSDQTAAEAESAGAIVYAHPYKIGNGAAVKSGIRQARGTILVMMDGDGQHRPEDLPKLLQGLETYDMVVGARTGKSKTSLHRNFANMLYNAFAGYVCGRRIHDLTSGFRAIKASIARNLLPLLPNTFSYPTTMTLAVVRSGYSLLYVHIETEKRIGKSKIKLLSDGTRFLLVLFKIATLYSPMKIFLPVSVSTFLLGLGYGLFKIFFMDSRYGPTSAMLITVSILMFLIGLVSEQVAQLRFDRNNRD
ncbi:MAG: glycosyltransferase family 2 protein [Deltaproteobacteria bacterium]|nr:glycosyltransferase family 2 protein [Deltaproteobacteria bacterium]